MKNEPFLLEEYKILKAKIETHEKRYYQMLVLSITGFITVMGISGKIPDNIIPYIIYPFLLVTPLVGSLSRQHQFFETAYLIEAFENAKISNITYEKAV